MTYTFSTLPETSAATGTTKAWTLAWEVYGVRRSETRYQTRLATISITTIIAPHRDPLDGAGTVSLKAQIDAKTAKKYKLGKKAVSVASGKAKPKGAGESTVKLKFTKTAVKRLKKAKSLKLKLTGTWTPAGGRPQKLSGSLTIKR